MFTLFRFSIFLYRSEMTQTFYFSSFAQTPSDDGQVEALRRKAAVSHFKQVADVSDVFAVPVVPDSNFRSLSAILTMSDAVRPDSDGIVDDCVGDLEQYVGEGSFVVTRVAPFTRVTIALGPHCCN